MISWIIKTSCLCYLPKPKAEADNTDLGFDNSWYHAQPHPLMIGQMALAIALPGFNDAGRSVTLIFLLMDPFHYRFSTFNKKMKKIYRLKVWIFFRKKHHGIPFFLTLRSSVRRFEIPLERLIVVKTLATLKLFMQQTHFCKIWLRWFASVDSCSIFSTINPFIT